MNDNIGQDLTQTLRELKINYKICIKQIGN